METPDSPGASSDKEKIPAYIQRYMPSTSIIIFDDDQEYVERNTRLLEGRGYHVIFSAQTILGLETTLKTHLEEVNRLISEGRPIVALIDNQAPWEPGENPDNRGVGGAAESRIKAAYGEETVLCVALTSTENPRYGVKHIRPEEGPRAIFEYLSSLRSKET